MTGLSGMMCLPTGRPRPERLRREEATDRARRLFPPIIREATPLILPADAIAATPEWPESDCVFSVAGDRKFNCMNLANRP